MSGERDFFVKLTEKNKKNILRLAGLLVLGLVLMAYSVMATDKVVVPEEQPTAVDFFTDEERLEHKVATALNRIEGVSEVSVSLTFARGSRYEYAVNSDVSSRLTEESGEAARKTTEEERRDEVVMTGTAPVIVEETMPRVQGVLIVGRGLENPSTALSVSRAAESLLGISPNKIVICPAK